MTARKVEIMHSSDRVKYAIFFSTLAIILMFLMKPKLMFREDGSMKDFGLGPQKTLISVGSCTLFVSVVSLYIFTWIDLVFA